MAGPPDPPVTPLRVTGDGLPVSLEAGADGSSPVDEPSCNLPQIKRHKTAMAVPPPRPALKGAGVTTAGAKEMLKTALESFNRRANVRVSIYQALVDCLVDTCSKWDDDPQASAADKAIAREVEKECGTVLSHLAVQEAPGEIVARLTDPSVPEAQRKPISKTTWAGIAAAGAARSRPTNTNQSTNSNARTSARPTARPARTTMRSFIETVAERRARAEEDERVLLKAREGSTRKAPVDVRVTLAGILKLSMSDIPAVTLTRSGYAVRFASTEERAKLLDSAVLPQLEQHLDVVGARMNEQWVNYVVPCVPSSIRAFDGSLMPLTVDMVAAEATLQAGAVPKEVKQSRHGANTETGLCTWIVSFLEPIYKPWSIYQSRNAVLVRKDRDPIEHHNPGCQAYCKPRRCTRLHRCNNCAADMATHAPGPCTTATRCANCRGPHQAGAPDCFATPGLKDGKRIPLTRLQIKRAKQKGQRAWETANAPDEHDTDVDDQLNEDVTMETNVDKAADENTAQGRKRGASRSPPSSQPEIIVASGSRQNPRPPPSSTLSRTQRAGTTSVNYNVLAMADKVFNQEDDGSDDQTML